MINECFEKGAGEMWDVSMSESSVVKWQNTIETKTKLLKVQKIFAGQFSLFDS